MLAGVGSGSSMAAFEKMTAKVDQLEAEAEVSKQLSMASSTGKGTDLDSRFKVRVGGRRGKRAVTGQWNQALGRARSHSQQHAQPKSTRNQSRRLSPFHRCALSSAGSIPRILSSPSTRIPAPTPLHPTSLPAFSTHPSSAWSAAASTTSSPR